MSFNMSSYTPCASGNTCVIHLSLAIWVYRAAGWLLCIAAALLVLSMEVAISQILYTPSDMLKTHKLGRMRPQSRPILQPYAQAASCCHDASLHIPSGCWCAELIHKELAGVPGCLVGHVQATPQLHISSNMYCSAASSCIVFSPSHTPVLQYVRWS